MSVRSGPRLGSPFIPCPCSLQGVSCRKITEATRTSPRDRNPGISVFPGGDGTHPLGLEFKQSSLAHAWPNSRTSIDPLTLGLTSLQPHAVVPSLLSDEGKRIVLPAFSQRGRDFPDKTRQTFATAHCFGPTRRSSFRRIVRAHNLLVVKPRSLTIRSVVSVCGRGVESTSS